MNIKEQTIKNYIKKVDTYINKKKYVEALEIAAKFPLKNGYVICQTRALDEFIVNKDDLHNINHVEKDNPHYKTASKMKIFLVVELEYLFKRRVRKNKI